MSVFDSNLAVIRNRQPDFCLKTGNNLLELEEIHSKSGAMTIKINKTMIHSLFDPVRESEKIVSGDDFKGVSLCIFYGFGLGYLVESFLKNHPVIPVLVVESCPELFSRSLALRDLHAVLEKANITFFVDQNPENIIKYLAPLDLDNVKVIKLRSLADLFPDYYRRIDQLIQGLLTKNEINLNTIKRFGKLWIRNLLKNMTVISTSPGISALEGIFSGIPSIVFASGPNLDSILPHVAELHDKFLFIVVDTSVRAFGEQGIEPDIVVVFDPQYWNTRHLDRIKCAGSLLVSESSTHPKVFQILKIPTFLGSSFFPLGEYFESIIGEKGKLGAGGSVATSAWDLARLLGTRPVFLAGLDLGYPDKATHFKGAVFENNFLNLSNRFRSACQMSFNYLYQADSLKLKSNNNRDILTDKRLIIYKWWFEKQIEYHPECETYNLSSAGIFLNGIPVKNISDLNNFPVCRGRINSVIQKIRNIYLEYQKDFFHRQNALKTSLLKIKNDLLTLKKLAGEGLKELSGPRKDSCRLDKINRIEQAMLSIESRQIISFLIQPLIQATLKDNKFDQYTLEENLNITEKFFKEIITSCRFHLTEISRLSA